MSTERKPPPDPTVGALTLHMPSFIPSHPQLWFILIELDVENYKITSDVSPFRWVAGPLSPGATLQVRKVALSSRNYDALKEAVISWIAPAEDQRIRQMPQGIELGSKKPSELLREMRPVKGANSGDDPMLGELRLQRLVLHLPPSLTTACKYLLDRRPKSLMISCHAIAGVSQHLKLSHLPGPHPHLCRMN